MKKLTGFLMFLMIFGNVFFKNHNAMAAISDEQAHEIVVRGTPDNVKKLLQSGYNVNKVYLCNTLLNTAIKSAVYGAFSTAHKQISPLIIDLDGDGIETTKTGNGTYFDHDGNDFAESTGWVGKDDGLLVRDINGNGQIDDGTELFGNNSVLSSGEKAANFSYLAMVTYPRSWRISL